MARDGHYGSSYYSPLFGKQRRKTWVNAVKRLDLLLNMTLNLVLLINSRF